MFGILLPVARLPNYRRKLKPFEAKTRGNGAAHQRPCAERLRCLPGVPWHDDLRALPVRQVRPEPYRLNRRTLQSDAKRQRRTSIEMPDLDRIDAMPVRSLACLQEKVDRGRVRSAIRAWFVSKHLAKVPALRMRLKTQEADDFVR
jgi:hypothetical protein